VPTPSPHRTRLADVELAAGLIAVAAGLTLAIMAAGSAQPTIVAPGIAFALGGSLIVLSLQQARRERVQGLLPALVGSSTRFTTHAHAEQSRAHTGPSPVTTRVRRRAAVVWVDQLALPPG